MKIKLFFFVFLISSLNFSAQNLVSNSSFENLDSHQKFLDWQTIVCGTSCTCGYNKIEMDKHLKFKIDGNIAAQLIYAPKCNGEGGKGEYIGCASYMQQKFKNHLEIGNCYKISYWVYCVGNRARMNKSAYNHLGVMLSNRQIWRNENNTIFEKNVLIPPTDSLQTDVWIKKESYVVPTCEINYLCIGVFKEEFWTDSSEVSLSNDYFFTYFLDKVSVEKINLTDKEIKNLKATSFAKYATDKKNQIFFVSGHTDNMGSNNTELSKNRANRVVQYLTDKYGLQKFRFITGYFADSKPIQSNVTEEGRALNRRVTIKEIYVQKVNACYREGLEDIEHKDYDHAFNMLNCWLSDDKDSEKLLVFFDPHLDVLKKFPLWKDVDKAVRKTYNKFKNSSYAFYLDSIYAEDQKYRKLSPYINDLSGYVKEIDTARWDFPVITDAAWMKEDSIIYVQILKAIDKNGFPKIDEVGRRAAHSIPMVIIHSLNIEAFKKYLPLMESYCKNGDAEWVYYALMYDKLCTMEEKPQRYGTQFVVSKENPEIITRYKCESLDAVNEWRRKIALSTFSEEEFNITAKSK